MGVPSLATPAAEPSIATPRADKRPGTLTAAGVWFNVQGVLGAIATIAIAVAVLYAIAKSASSAAGIGLLAIVGLIVGSFAYADFVAARRLLDRDSEGRPLGMFLAGLGVLGGLTGLMTGDAIALIAGAINLTVVYYLWKTEDLAR